MIYFTNSFNLSTNSLSEYESYLILALLFVYSIVIYFISTFLSGFPIL